MTLSGILWTLKLKSDRRFSVTSSKYSKEAANMTIAWNRRLGNLGIDNSWTVRYEWFRFRILFKKFAENSSTANPTKFDGIIYVRY